jgi:hypothetical protein
MIYIYTHTLICGLFFFVFIHQPIFYSYINTRVCFCVIFIIRYLYSCNFYCNRYFYPYNDNMRGFFFCNSMEPTYFYSYINMCVFFIIFIGRYISQFCVIFLRDYIFLTSIFFVISNFIIYNIHSTI